MSDEKPVEPAKPVKPVKLSPVEGFKAESRFLRGVIREDLASDQPAMSKTSEVLLKFHGTYQQDDRDSRKDAAKKAAGKAYSFMVRSRIPGGKLTPAQLLAEIDMCDEIGNTTLRVTTRQGVQHHGVLKENLWELVHRINEIQLTTLAACGDVNRNVMACPAPFKNDLIRGRIQQLCDELTVHFLPATRAYHELWIETPGEEKQLVGGGEPAPDFEPIYGPTYLPRKFKMAVALPEDNCVDAYANDLGMMAVHDGLRVVGWNVMVGGGMGVTPSAKKTFAMVAKEICYVPDADAVRAAEAVVKLQRDHGNRSDRKTARVKYVVAQWGADKFRDVMQEYFGGPLEKPKPIKSTGVSDHLGWHEQGDGKVFYGLYVENGRIKDEGDYRLKSALRAALKEFPCGVRLTAHQNILFTDLDPSQKRAFTDVFRKHGVPVTEDRSLVRRLSMACPAWPTCGLAITEAERAHPEFMDQLDAILVELGLSKEVFSLHMTGCPNGCARPYNSDVGIVGKSVGTYTVFIGGSTVGDRLSFIYRDKVPADQVVPALRGLLERFAVERQGDENFGDFCHRLGPEGTGAEVPAAVGAEEEE